MKRRQPADKKQKTETAKKQLIQKAYWDGQTEKEVYTIDCAFLRKHYFTDFSAGIFILKWEAKKLNMTDIMGDLYSCKFIK